MHETLDGSGMQVVATWYMKMNLNEMRLFSPHFFFCGQWNSSPEGGARKRRLWSTTTKPVALWDSDAKLLVNLDAYQNYQWFSMQPRLGCDRPAGNLNVLFLEYCIAPAFTSFFCTAVAKKWSLCKCCRSRVLKLWLWEVGFPYLYCLFAFAVFPRVSRSSHYLLHTLIVPVTCNPLN